MNLLKYAIIGIFNTVNHWFVFYCVFILTGNQAISNGLGFLSSATLSYVINSKYNFNKKLSFDKYMKFFVILGLLSFSVGSLADKVNLYFILTLIYSSVINLFLGFIISKYYIFKG